MNEYSKIQIRGNEIYIDNKKVSGVRSIDLYLSAENIPTADVQIELDGNAEYEGIGAANIRIVPETIREATRAIRFAIEIDREFRQAIEESIADVLERHKGRENKEIASAIAERIFDPEEIAKE